MARIPEEEIDRVKRETDLAALVRSRGIELKKHGNGHLIGLCPFHDDRKTPNLVVTPGKGLFHCLGCGKAGNAIQFVQYFDGVSFRHAYELLNESGDAAFRAPPRGRAIKQNSVPRLENPFDPDAADADLMNQVIDYYHDRLLKTAAARDYLRNRGLYDPDTVKRFRIGFADRSLGLRLPPKTRVEGKAIRERLQTLGIYRASGHEHLNGSIVVPVFDENGTPVELYGRRITRPARNTPEHLYLPGPHRGIWNPEALEHADLILCEAPFDALTFYVNGFTNTTFIYGVQGFMNELYQAILDRPTQTVYLAYDADDPGNRAAERDAARLGEHGVQVFRIRFPAGMDANEYACSLTPAGKSLQLAINTAKRIRTTVKDDSFNLAANKKAAKQPEDAAKEKRPDLSASVCPAGAGPGQDGGTLHLEERGDVANGSPGYLFTQLGPREYRIGGLAKNNSLEVMKISLRLRLQERFHLDGLDLLRDGDRRRFVERAAHETGLGKDLIKQDLRGLLLALERRQEERIAAATRPDPGRQGPEISPEERAEALNFLKTPNLIERIQSAFENGGLVGETNNRLAAYLACTSRKLERPLAVIIQSTSAAGKSTLMESVLSFFPEEDRIKYSAMTGQSLYYLGETDLKHRILAIVEEEGAEKAGYALKLLQSEGELTIASTGKDPRTGRMETQEYHVEGPVMIFLTTTAVDIDEELLNRCLVLSVDESKEQTDRIHALQRKARTLSGLVAREEKKDALRVLKNVQRLLEPMPVVNGYAEQLTFTNERTRTRRDHEKYLSLIESIALLHQHQRRIERQKVHDRQVPFIRVTLEDIRLANRIAPEILGRSLDELPPQTRRLYEAVKQLVRERARTEEQEQRFITFSRREIRDRLGWGVTQVRVHMDRLRELEYIAARQGRPGRAFQYELLTDCNEETRPDHVGLIDVEKIQPECLGDARQKRVRHHPSVAEAMEDKPDGENGNLAGG